MLCQPNENIFVNTFIDQITYFHKYIIGSCFADQMIFFSLNTPVDQVLFNEC